MPDRSRQHRKGGLPPTPPLTPIDAANLGSQVTSLYQNYLDSRTLLAAQSAGLRGLFQTQRGGILSQQRQDLSANEGSMIERGLEGGTGQITSEADIHGAAAAQVAAARNSMLQGLIANRGAAIQARRNYEGGLLNLKLAAGAQNDVQNIIDQMLQNTGPSGGGGGGDGGGGAGGGNGGGGGGGGGGAGGGGGGDQGITDYAQGRLEHMTNAIQNTIDSYGQTRDQQLRLQYLEHAKDVWRRRNQIRVKWGMDPKPISLLMQQLQDAGGGGGPHGQT